MLTVDTTKRITAD